MSRLTDHDDFLALRPFFRIVEEALTGMVDGADFFDTLAEDIVVDYVVTVRGCGCRSPARRSIVWTICVMESCRIAVRLTPRARADEIVGARNGVLLVRVSAVPEGGRANAALCRLLAKRAGVGVRCVSVVRGAASREKIVCVDGISAEGLRQALKLEALASAPDINLLQAQAVPAWRAGRPTHGG